MARARAAQDAQGGLERLDPSQPALGLGPQGEAEAAFDDSAWHERLSAVDLDARERSFDELVARARRDEIARGYLQRLARDPIQVELAWTARLALREAERGTSLLRLVDPFGGEDWEALGGPWREMQSLIEELRSPHAHPAPPRAPTSGAVEQKSHSFSLEQGPDRCVLRVTQIVDGQESTQEYEGRTLEEILQQNPALETELGLSTGAPASGLRLRLGEADASALLERFEGRMRSLQGLGQPRLFRLQTPFGAMQGLRTDILGVRVGPVSMERARELGLGEGTGLFVSSVYPGTIASALGVGAGDVLVELNGKALATADDISGVLRSRRADEGLVLGWFDAQGVRRSATWNPPLAAGPAAERREF
jgi:hypothetical protein